MPLLWLRHHLKRPDLIAPGEVDAAALADDSILYHLAGYNSHKDDPDELRCRWRVIVGMDEVLAVRLNQAHSAA